MACREIPPPGEFLRRYKEAVAYPTVAAIVLAALVFGPSSPDAVLYVALAALFAPTAAWAAAKATCALSARAAGRGRRTGPAKGG